MTEPTLKDLQLQIEDLKNTVAKQRKVITETAEQVLRIQVNDTKQKMNNIKIPDIAGNSNSNDSTDYATNEDLVQLVGELQGQLNILEQKSMIRILNASKKNDGDELIKLPNFDGEYPLDTLFPKNVEALIDLSDDSLIELCKFYQLMPVTLEEEARMQAFIEGKINSPNDHLADFEPPADDYPAGLMNDLFNELTKFLGVVNINRK